MQRQILSQKNTIQLFSDQNLSYENTAKKGGILSILFILIVCGSISYDCLKTTFKTVWYTAIDAHSDIIWNDNYLL